MEIASSFLTPQCRLGVKTGNAQNKQMLPPLATGERTFRIGRFVPRAEVGDLFDYLVGQQLERVRHGEAEGGGGLEINDQLVFGRKLNGQIARI